VTDLRDSHLKKHHSPIDTIFGGITIEERLEHQAKQCRPIEVREFGRKMHVSA
jgi:hypothetical protein